MNCNNFNKILHNIAVIILVVNTTMLMVNTAPFDQSYYNSLKKETLAKPPKPEDIIFNGTEWNKTTCGVEQKLFILRHPHCFDKYVNLTICRGACNSIYIPGNNIQDTLKMCRSCQPTSRSYKIVTMFCPYARVKKIRKHKIELFTRCECNWCEEKFDANK